jgi:NAD(P)-dependent dehydrogenase (short-subunit alcohol dehydrogenase family)
VTRATDEAGRLSGRVALVTGGSRGVGRAIAVRLAADGATVVINYRNDHIAAAEVTDEITKVGGLAFAYRASVSDADEVAGMLAKISDMVGPIDLFVSNAGIASRGNDIHSTALKEFHDQLSVHALGPISLLQNLLPDMRSADRGDIIMISSSLTDLTPACGAPYTMAKTAMEAAMRTLAREERSHGIRVNIVAPGVVATDMGERLISASTGGKSVEQIDAAYPFGHVCRPEDVAGVVTFLASANASYITGQRIVVDGGGPEVSIVTT